MRWALTSCCTKYVALVVKNAAANSEDVRDEVRSLGQEDPLEMGMATHPLQYSCLENPMDRGAWRATVHGVAKSWTRLK